MNPTVGINGNILGQSYIKQIEDPFKCVEVGISFLISNVLGMEIEKRNKTSLMLRLLSHSKTCILILTYLVHSVFSYNEKYQKEKNT